MVSTHLKNISQNGNLPQVGVKIKIAWNHHLVIIFATQNALHTNMSKWFSVEHLVNRNHHDKWLFPKGTELQIQPKKLDLFVWCLEKSSKHIIPKNGALIILYHGRKPLKNITNKNQIQENHHLGVSENGRTPKSSIFNRVSIINHPFWGTPISGNTHLSTTKTAPHLPRRMLNLALRFIGKMVGKPLGWRPLDNQPLIHLKKVVFIGYIPF